MNYNWKHLLVVKAQGLRLSCVMSERNWWTSVDVRVSLDDTHFACALQGATVHWLHGDRRPMFLLAQRNSVLCLLSTDGDGILEEASQIVVAAREIGCCSTCIKYWCGWKLNEVLAAYPLRPIGTGVSGSSHLDDPLGE